MNSGHSGVGTSGAAPGTGPLGVLSPHLDDAVLSCARVLAAHRGSLVVTVFSGGPRAVDPLPPWDAASGFGAGDDVMAVRGAEDAAALGLLGAHGEHLGLWDFQYRVDAYGYSEPAGGLAAATVAAIDRVVAAGAPQAWLLPLGILHPDHRATASAAWEVARARPEVTWLVYEELPYHVAFPRQRAEALARLHDAGFALGGTEVAACDTADKAAAVACYASQVPALAELGGVDAALDGAELVHRLVPA